MSKCDFCLCLWVSSLCVELSGSGAALKARSPTITFFTLFIYLLAPFLGFYDIVPEPLLSVFDFQELELLLHGLPNIDMDDWVKNTEYTGGCLFVFVLFLCVFGHLLWLAV